MTVTVSNVQVQFHVDPPKITYLQGCDMAIPALQDAFRSIEETEEGRAQPVVKIVKASGNENFSADGSVKNALTLTVLPPYVQGFEAGAVPFQSSTGNLLGTFVDSPGAIVQINNAVGSLNLNSAAIEHSSYDNAVHVDLSSSYSGTTYPVGTPRQRVNNFYDAKAIAIARGFTTINITGSATLPADIDLTNFILIGQNANLTQVSIPDGADVSNCEFQESLVTGTLDGGCIIRHSMITSLSYISGVIFETMLAGGTISLGGGSTAHFLDCYSGPPTIPPVHIDMNGSGNSLSMQGYRGEAHLSNKSGADKVEINLDPGIVVLDDTVTNGTIMVNGVGQLLDQAGNEIPSGTWNGCTIINRTVSGSFLQTALKFIRRMVGGL